MRATTAVAEFGQTSWHIVGITVVLLLVAEGTTRVYKDLKAPDRDPVSQSPLDDPMLSRPWFREFSREFNDTRRLAWRPYVYFGRTQAYAGRYVNIDSTGHRIVPQPTTPATPEARVYLFGGSTMWGNAQRDSGTIAAEVARRLQTIADPGQRIEVTNFGENGYVMTQGVLQLILALRAGERPDVAVFYEGINDAGSTVMSGLPGIPQNERKRAADFALGRALDRDGFQRGIGKDARAIAAAVREMLGQSEFVAAVRSLRPARPPHFISTDSATSATLHSFVESARLVEALSAAYGFVPIYMWQPTVHGTTKPLTPFEQRIQRWIDADPFNRRLREVHQALPARMDSAMTALVGNRFIDGSTLFHDEKRHIFVDWVGHTTEEANPAIVDALWPALDAAVASHLARPHPVAIQ